LLQAAIFKHSDTLRPCLQYFEHVHSQHVQTCVTHFDINLILRGFYLQQYSSYEFYYFGIIILLYFTLNTYLLHFQCLFQYPLYFERLLVCTCIHFEIMIVSSVLGIYEYVIC
jgi:hypothetical protein